MSDKGHSAALILAAGSFRDARLGNYPDVEMAAKELGRALTAAPHEFQVKTMIGRQTRKSDVEFELDELALDGPRDRLFVIYIGGGLTLTHEGEEIGLLACYDSNLDNPDSFITTEEIMSVRMLSGVRHVAFLFDAPITAGALGLVDAPHLPSGVEASAARAHVAMSGGTNPNNNMDYVFLTPELIEILHPLEFRDWEYMNVAKRLQRWLINNNATPQILQAGHLDGSHGGAFSFGAPPITAHWDPRYATTKEDGTPALTQAEEEAFSETDRRMKERFDKLERQKRMLEELSASLKNND